MPSPLILVTSAKLGTGVVGACGLLSGGLVLVWVSFHVGSVLHRDV